MIHAEEVGYSWSPEPKVTQPLHYTIYVMYMPAFARSTGHCSLLMAGEKDSLTEALDLAREYLELHEVNATYLAKSGTVRSLPKVMDELDVNLLLGGGYRYTLSSQFI